MNTEAMKWGIVLTATILSTVIFFVSAVLFSLASRKKSAILMLALMIMMALISVGIFLFGFAPAFFHFQWMPMMNWSN